MLYDVLKSVALTVMRLYFRLEWRGSECVPRSGPVLLVANHSSMLDPPIIGAACPRTLTYLAKAELFAVPGLGRLIHALHARPVRREGSDARALKDALRVLKGGEALLMFPEGTRGAEGLLREGKAGAGMLAVMSGAAVVPVYIRGTGRALPRGGAFPRPGKVTVRFGAPIHFKPAAAESRKDHYRVVTVEMMRAIAELRDAA